MGRLIARRLVFLVPTLLVVSFAVFMIEPLLPTDVATAVAGESASEEDLDEIREALDLDEPLLERYGVWLGRVVQLDFGESLIRGTSVGDDLAERLPVTLGLMGAATVVGLVVGVPLGVMAGLRAGRWPDTLSRVTASLGGAIPHFWLASILVLVFAVQRQWFPPLGYTHFTDSPFQWLRTITLPALALGIGIAAPIARQLRGSLLDVLDTSYVRTAWAKGVGTRVAVGKHALKNAFIPSATVLGLQVSHLIGGAIIIEQIFAIPGLGRFLLDSIFATDLPALQGVVVVLVVIQVGLTLLVDIAYGLLNPKVRVA